MGKYDNMDTDKIVAVRFQHLNTTWLDEVNEMVGWLKQKFSGNGRMSVPWSHGSPLETEWTLKPDKKKKR